MVVLFQPDFSLRLKREKREKRDDALFLIFSGKFAERDFVRGVVFYEIYELAVNFF